MKYLKYLFAIIYFLIIFFIFKTTSLQTANKKTYQYSLSMYHFNVQYVAGDKKAEERIIQESFAPLVDMYLRHPNWGGDFEMQGYMLELMNEKFPDIFKKFQKIVNSGQVDLVCFHYADQLFLAFPEKDMQWSEKLNQKIFSELNIKRSKVVFTQEGQFGEGMFYFMKKNGEDIAAYPHNLYEYFHTEEDSEDAYPLYSHPSGVDIILSGRRAKYEDDKIIVQMNWSKSGDAEFVATGKNPYAGKSFKYDKKILQEYEDSLIQQEKNGVKICKVSQYVKELKNLGIKPKPFKPILDGTWQPEDTDNLWLWMGKHKSNYEKDVPIRSINFYLRNDLTAAETLINFAKEKKLNCAEEEKMLTTAWKHQLLSEVSDSTGWFPFPIEIRYSFDEAIIVKDLVAKIFKSLKDKLKYKFVEVDSYNKKVKELKKEPQPKDNVSCPKWITKLLFAGLEQSRGTSVNFYCKKIAKNRIDVEIVFFIFKSGDYAKFYFPLKNNKIVYSPALMEDKLVEYNLSDFNFPEKQNYTYIGCANGLIGLNNNLFLIKHNAFNNLAIKIDKNKKVIGIEVENIAEKSSWYFSFIKGDKKIALQEANKINVFPTLVK